MTLLDEPKGVRAGEELPAEPLRAFLETALPELREAGPLTVSQFPRGFSNLTYLVKVGERELVLRRPPAGAQVKGGHDMLREARLLARLHPAYPKAPKPLAVCEDPSVLGAPFYVMERVRGVILRAQAPEGFPLDPQSLRRLSEALVDGLAELHRLDVKRAGLEDLGRPGYVERQVSGWTERWQRARTDEVPAVEGVTTWLAAHRPPEGDFTLVHNDYKYDNVVLDPQEPTRIVAVLDWEMATVGNPLLDLGTSLAYWVDPDDPEGWRRSALSDLTLREGSLRRAQVAERWARATGRSLDHLVFAYAFGLFKVAVICQQIYARFQKGLTRDPRFAQLIHVVRACGALAAAAAARGRIERLAE